MPYLLADKGLGVCCRGDKLDHLHVRIAVAVGSTPVLKIALPSSPLPEHRSDRSWRF